MDPHPLQIVPATDEPAVPTSTTAAWLHEHPYMTLILGATTLVLIGAIITLPSREQSTDPQLNTWGGPSGIFDPGEARLLPEPSAVRQPFATSSGPSITIPIYTSVIESSDGHDIETLVSELMQKKEQVTQTSSDLPNDPWLGFTLSLSNAGIANTGAAGIKSPLQESITQYGNTAGSVLKNFESGQRGAVGTVQAFLEARTDATKKTAMLRLATEMQSLSDALKKVSAPSEFQDAHSSYSTSYADMAHALENVAQSSSDEELLASISTYNTAVETGARRFAVLVGLFSAYNVTFSSSEGGSAFMFSPAGAL